MHPSIRMLLTLSLALVSAQPAAAADGAEAIGVEEARELLFGPLPDKKAEASCLDKPVRKAGEETAIRIRCLIRKRYAKDKQAAKLALKLYDRTGGVAGLLEAQDMDGGYRGHLKLVPHLPVGKDRVHLARLTGALIEMDDFFEGIQKAAGKPVNYRWRNLRFRFYRSVKRRTPAAFASGWTIGYNVRGTLNYSTRAVRDLMFHEIFHLNDQAAGDWSDDALGEIHAIISKRCGRKIKCLTPYTRGWLKVRKGTYYAFMPGHGPEEYAAELALNYLREQRKIQQGKKVPKPFKCGPELNAKAWKLITEAFFAGADLVPDCKKKKTP